MGNSDGEEKKGGFKVMDRRRFDSAGDDRDSESTLSSSSQPSQPLESAQPRRESPQPQQHVAEPVTRDEPEEGITFASFVMSLATQTLMQLGQMKPPSGMEVPVDVEGAKQTIDILAMLERRTRGNLDAEETRMMTEILHSLRMSFVQGVPKR